MRRNDLGGGSGAGSGIGLAGGLAMSAGDPSQATTTGSEPLTAMLGPLLPADTPFYVVLNAGSGHLETDERIATIRGVLTAAGRRHELVPVSDPRNLVREGERAVAWAQANQGAVVAAGGDGTINAMAQLVLPTGLPFGVLPQGTFNYFGRAHGIPTETEQAVSALLTARVHPVQVGMVNDRLFLVNGSMGLYPQLLDDREAFKKRFGRSRPVAVLAALATLFGRHRNWEITLEADGEVKTVVTPTLFVGNNILQLHQIGIEEAPALREGQLVAIMVKPLSRLGMFGLLMRGARGQLGAADQVTSLAFTRLTVAPRAPHKPRRLKVATDGEIAWLQTPLQFGVAPQALRLLVPG